MSDTEVVRGDSSSEAPTHHLGRVRGIDWNELCPWLVILRSFRISTDARQLLLGTLGVLLTAAGWWVFAQVFAGSTEPRMKSLVETYGVWPWRAASPFATVGFSGSFAPGEGGSPSIYVPGSTWLPRDPFLGSWRGLSRPFWDLFGLDLGVASFTFLLCCGLWSAAIWALMGGAISRMAAVRFTRDEKISMGRALEHARTKWGAYFWAPLFPLTGSLILAMPMVLIGWMLRFDAGVIVLSLLWPFFLVIALVMTVMLVGAAFGWPLMWATISTEGTDSFDGLSRSYAYVFQRPLHYFFYAMVATLVGVVAGFFVWLFATGVVYLSFWGTSWTSGRERMDRVSSRILPPFVVGDYESQAAADAQVKRDPANDEFALGKTGTVGARIIALWVSLVKLAALGFGASYFWTASSCIYLLLRAQVDATELDEVHLNDEDDAYALPPMKVDSQGVPVPVDLDDTGSAIAGESAGSGSGAAEHSG